MSTPVPVITITRPTPIEEFGNSRLRDSITEALKGVEPGHGNALFQVSNKGIGTIAVHRFEDKILFDKVTWAAVAGVRYNFGEGVEVQATLVASWD